MGAGTVTAKPDPHKPKHHRLAHAMHKHKRGLMHAAPNGQYINSEHLAFSTRKAASNGGPTGAKRIGK